MMRRINFHHRVPERDDVGYHGIIDVCLGLKKRVQLPLGDVSWKVSLVLAPC